MATLLRGKPLTPLGMERWAEATVRLPSRLAEASLINVFTGERIKPVVQRSALSCRWREYSGLAGGDAVVR